MSGKWISYREVALRPLGKSATYARRRQGQLAAVRARVDRSARPLHTACGAGWRQPAPGPPPSTCPSAIGAAAQGQVFYAQAASYAGQDAWTRARRGTASTIGSSSIES
jgi:hypothetical protein